ncbi:MAG TPA: hypothetical protein VH300_19520 [Thermoleophilaceae bacterium]|jgi:hypothetical protein|nr:hypothetical protein [Thermoleophilaceae bacterium]
MLTPLNVLNRMARPPQLMPPAKGRCPVCHELIRDSHSMLTLRGGIHVHRACATYRTRQRARVL